MNTDETTSHPTLILIRGLPGSGKSYLADAIQASLGADKVVVVDPDKTDLTSEAYLAMAKALTAEGVDEKFHPYRYIRAQAYDGIEGHKIVIWNQGFTNLDGFNKTIVNLEAYATDHGTKLPVLVVEVEIGNHDVAKQRVAKRAASGGHDVNEENFARFINDYHSFADQGYNLVSVNGEDDIATSVTSVTSALHDLWKK